MKKIIFIIIGTILLTSCLGRYAEAYMEPVSGMIYTPSSKKGVEYELYISDSATGITKTGTGNPLIFGKGFNPEKSFDVIKKKR